MPEVINVSHGDLGVPLDLTQLTISLEDGWVVIDYEADFPDYAAHGPLPAEVTTDGRTLSATDSMPVMESLRVQDDLLLASAGPHVLSIGDGAFDIDLTSWVEDVLPEREGAEIAVTDDSTAHLADDGRIEVEAVWENYGPEAGSRAETLRLNGDAHRVVSVRQLPAGGQATERIVFTAPDADAATIEIGTWETTLDLTA